jgi:hypothetical protein
MNKIEKQILLENDPWESYYYCLANQEIADIKAHERIIIKSFRVCYFFAIYINKADKQLLSEIVLQSGNLEYIKKFYNDVSFDKTRYEALMLFI